MEYIFMVWYLVKHRDYFTLPYLTTNTYSHHSDALTINCYTILI